MTATILRGNALTLPLADASVDLIVTSPPYFGLRSYQDGGEHYDGQIGSEATIGEWLDAMIAATAEMVRVLKPSGSIFVDLGDKYAGSRMDGSSGWATAPLDHDPGKKKLGALADSQGTLRTRSSVPTKSLMLLPERYRIRCVDELGLIARAVIIWAKPNGLPESVTDRVRRSHEDWVHLVKQPRYFSAIDEIREEHTDPARRAPTWDERRAGGEPVRQGEQRATASGGVYASSSLGKLPGSVWTIPTQPLTVPPELGVDHFAAFPMEWPRRIIQGWTSPVGNCTACGEGRRPVPGVDWTKVPHKMVERRALSDAERAEAAELFRDWQDAHAIPSRAIAELFPSRTGGLTGCVANWRQGFNTLTPEQVDVIEDRFGSVPARLRELVSLTRLLPVAEFDVGIGGEGTGRHRNRHSVFEPKGYRSITGYACACPHPTAPTTPALVLDPFGGTGTVALVAKALGRHGISLDMSADYCRLATWRTTDEGELARALQVEKPAKQVDGQLSLLEAWA